MPEDEDASSVITKEFQQRLGVLDWQTFLQEQATWSFFVTEQYLHLEIIIIV